MPHFPMTDPRRSDELDSIQNTRLPLDCLVSRVILSGNNGRKGHVFSTVLGTNIRCRQGVKLPYSQPHLNAAILRVGFLYLFFVR